MDAAFAGSVFDDLGLEARRVLLEELAVVVRRGAEES